MSERPMMNSYCWYRLDGHDQWHAWSYDHATRDHDLAYAPPALSICNEVDGAPVPIRVVQHSWSFLAIPSQKMCIHCAGIVISATQQSILSKSHTCTTGSRSTCPPCMKFQIDLWEAINRYAEACGGDTSDKTVGAARMDAVVAVNDVIQKAAKEGDIR